MLHTLAGIIGISDACNDQIRLNEFNHASRHCLQGSTVAKIVKCLEQDRAAMYLVHVYMLVKRVSNATVSSLAIVIVRAARC